MCFSSESAWGEHLLGGRFGDKKSGAKVFPAVSVRLKRSSRCIFSVAKVSN